MDHQDDQSRFEMVMTPLVSYLPARTLASLACVVRSAKQAVDEQCLVPICSSGISYQWNTKNAVKEVLDSALSVPMRPQFAIAFANRCHTLSETYSLLRSRLPPFIPILVYQGEGVIGIEQGTGHTLQIKATRDDYRTNTAGLSLFLGHLPDMEVKFVQYGQLYPPDAAIQFCKEIYSVNEAPSAILLFDISHYGRLAALAIADSLKEMFPNTVMAGFLDGFVCYGIDVKEIYEMAVVVFARKSCSSSKAKSGWSSHFHTFCSNRLTKVGPIFKARDVEQICVRFMPLRTKQYVTDLNGEYQGLTHDSRGMMTIINEEMDMMGRTLEMAASRDAHFGHPMYLQWIDYNTVNGKLHVTLPFVVHDGHEYGFLASSVASAEESSMKVREDISKLQGGALVTGGLLFSCSERGQTIDPDNILDAEDSVSTPLEELSNKIAYAGAFTDCGVDNDSHNEFEASHVPLRFYRNAFDCIFFLISYPRVK